MSALSLASQTLFPVLVGVAGSATGKRVWCLWGVFHYNVECNNWQSHAVKMQSWRANGVSSIA